MRVSWEDDGDCNAGKMRKSVMRVSDADLGILEGASLLILAFCSAMFDPC